MLTANSLAPGDIHNYNCYGATSAAMAIIAGAALSVQGMVQAHMHHRLTPTQMRNLFRNPVNGTPAAGANGPLLGSMPNLKAIAELVLSGAIAGTMPAPASVPPAWRRKESMCAVRSRN